jgi:hypothetical protein
VTCHWVSGNGSPALMTESAKTYARCQSSSFRPKWNLPRSTPWGCLSFRPRHDTNRYLWHSDNNHRLGSFSAVVNIFLLFYTTSFPLPLRTAAVPSSFATRDIHATENRQTPFLNPSPPPRRHTPTQPHNEGTIPLSLVVQHHPHLAPPPRHHHISNSSSIGPLLPRPTRLRQPARRRAQVQPAGAGGPARGRHARVHAPDVP